MSTDRTLTWDGCLNIRDLGSLPTADGGTTRFGAIVRADSVRQLSDEGWEALVDYGVRRIVDLRFDSVLAADPPQELPVEVAHVPALPDSDSDHWPEIDAIGDAAPDAAAATRAVYLEFLERFGPRFAHAIDAIAGPSEGSVLVHCLGTGRVSFRRCCCGWQRSRSPRWRPTTRSAPSDLSRGARRGSRGLKVKRYAGGELA